FLKRVQQAHPNDFWCNQRLGRDTYLIGKHEETIRYCQAALAIRSNPEVHRVLGMALSATGRAEEALEQYRLAIKLDPMSFYPHYTRGNLLLDLHRYDEALADFQTCFETRQIDDRHAYTNEPRPHNNRAAVHANIGLVLEAQGQWEKAVIQYKQAVKVDPT